MSSDFKKGYTTRTEKRKFEEEIEKKKKEHEKELDESRKELKKLIFDDDEEIGDFYHKKEKNKKPTFTNIILSLTLIFTLLFVGFIIYDSTTKIDPLYEIINSIIILITMISFLIAFKRSYHYQKTFASIFTAICFVTIMSFNGLYFSGVIKLPSQKVVPDFSKTTLTKAIKWAEVNDISYNQTYEYSDFTPKYQIFSQSVKPGTLIKDIKKINFEVSNGPDYEKEVILPDVTGWNIDDVVTIIDENFLNNVSVKYEENKNINKDIVISQNKTGNIKRNDSIELVVSLGSLENLGEITMKDLNGLPVFKSTLYLNRNNIDYELKYAFSKTTLKGNTIKSSIKKGELIKPGDKIKLTISKGKKIIVPDLTNMKISEVTKWMINNNLKIKYSDKYDNTIKKGRVIEASYKKDDVIEEETVIEIIVSKGKLVMPSFSSLAQFKAWANQYEIKYDVKEEFNDDVQKGEIINFSIKENNSINLDEGVTAYVSKGKSLTVPDFIGKSKKEAQKLCQDNNLNCTFVTTTDSTKEENTCIKQSVDAGSKASTNESIKITITKAN